MENLRRMAMFAAVVEARSFSGAARRLGLTKSAVSRQVGLLERHLGVRLLHRTTRKIDLTEAGEIFHQSCARIVAEAQEAERAVTRLRRDEEPQGTLRVQAPVALGDGFVAPLLAAFLREIPDLKAELVVDDGLGHPEEQGLDVVIRVGPPTDPSLVARKIASLRQVVCAAPSYLATHGEPQTPEDLCHHEWVVGPSVDRQIFLKNGRLQAVPIRERLASKSTESIRLAVLAGLGLGRLPVFLVERDLDAGRLVPVLPQYETPAEELYAVFAKSRQGSPRVRLFVDFLTRAGPPAGPTRGAAGSAPGTEARS